LIFGHGSRCLEGPVRKEPKIIPEKDAKINGRERSKETDAV
jgi:hypothetical protein